MERTEKRTSINFEEVAKSYNGRCGCMCGCRGTYRIPSHVPLAEANAEVGYEAYAEHNDRAVKIAVAKLNREIDWADEDKVAAHVTDDCAWFKSGDRVTVVYFRQPAEVEEKKGLAAR